MYWLVQVSFNPSVRDLPCAVNDEAYQVMDLTQIFYAMFIIMPLCEGK